MHTTALRLFHSPFCPRPVLPTERSARAKKIQISAPAENMCVGDRQTNTVTNLVVCNMAHPNLWCSPSSAVAVAVPLAPYSSNWTSIETIMAPCCWYVDRFTVAALICHVHF
jgi:hypothetical protein